MWEDTASAAPSAASAHQLGQEAENAATHFGNTTTASNRDTQYVIVSPTGANPDDYKTQGSARGTTTAVIRPWTAEAR